MWFVIALTLFYGPYNATVREVINAETIKFEVAIWPGEQKLIEIGVLGVDTPSLVGLCDAEELLAKEALEMTLVFIGTQARISDVRQSATNGKFYAKVRNKRGKLLSEALIESGYGVPYEKGKKHSWCPE